MNAINLKYKVWPILVIALFVTPAEAEEVDSDSLQLGTKAVSIDRTAPRYPAVELRRGRQGWVELSYVVTKDGNVVDPIVQDSSGSSYFEKAATEIVEDWLYEPATWNGKAIQQCENKVLITFAVEDAGKEVTLSYANKHKKISKELEEGNLEKARELIDKQFESKNLTLPELSWLWSLEAHYAGLVGDKQAQLAAVKRATISNGRWVTDDLYPSLLLIQTIRELELGNYSAAFRSHEKLLETKAEYPQLDVIQDNIERLQAVVASDATYAVPAQISEDKWSYSLLRNRFSLAQVNGDLGNLEIRCARNRVVDEARMGTSWEIPENWGACSVIVFGSSGTTFNLLEQPDA
ncbi:MAG: energy transducer TonB [Woeseiaceae bacterium]